MIVIMILIIIITSIMDNVQRKEQCLVNTASIYLPHNYLSPYRPRANTVPTLDPVVPLECSDICYIILNAFLNSSYVIYYFRESFLQYISSY